MLMLSATAQPDVANPFQPFLSIFPILVLAAGKCTPTINCIFYTYKRRKKYFYFLIWIEIYFAKRGKIQTLLPKIPRKNIVKVHLNT